MNKTHLRRFFRLRKFLQKVGLIIALLFTLLLTPATAQSNTLAPVVLDGRELFQVTGSEQFPAQGRADWISSQLQTLAESKNPPDIKIAERNQSPTIYINDRYLLTVTQADTDFGRSPKQQANIWAEQLGRDLQKAQEERSIKFIWRTSVLVV
ncbi:MAG: mechanosensitive ion channel protein MscS, partial [Moorea sp. SIO2B7]|nr:mechanosensitive ion channel protein MscS [Moorena sp. SIO2B7]